jgi:hypothetical protein
MVHSVHLFVLSTDVQAGLELAVVAAAVARNGGVGRLPMG